jgi:hypothetical protein
MTVQITAGQFHGADGVEDWRSLYHVVSAYFRTGSLAQGIALVDEIGRLATGAEQQYINVDLRHAGVTVFLSLRDVALARRISAAVEGAEIRHYTCESTPKAQKFHIYRDVPGSTAVGLQAADKGAMLGSEILEDEEPVRQYEAGLPDGTGTFDLQPA